ncbi:hypothetical protein SPAN111604_04625 [Sphingomonas antarctica]|uniref:hypothetical protein n=1 Tax=Sphingomonas antarctica TaxID=2040274 RepID=UPI0039E9DBAB
MPVRRRRRADGWTPERQRRFVEVLADTGVVKLAAMAVNMTEQAAYALKRAPGAEGFAAAWRAALDNAADLLEATAYERVLRGVEQTIYARDGSIIGTRIVYNDRLLQFLLRAHRPEIYARDTERERNAAKRETRATSAGDCRPASLQAGSDEAGVTPAQAPSVAEALRAMEPQLPAPPEDLSHDIVSDIQCADIMDGEISGHWRDWTDPGDFALPPEKEAALERLKHAPPVKTRQRRKRVSGLKLD